MTQLLRKLWNLIQYVCVLFIVTDFNEEIFKLLIKSGANFEAVNGLGRTAL